MAKKTQSVVVVPNLSGEVFDVAGTSVSENYAMTSISGLSDPVETNWESLPPNDASLQNISATVNVKSLTTRYTGIPDSVAKIARNISVVNGPVSVDPVVSPDYSEKWAIIHRDGQTVVRKLSDNTETTAATLDPPNAAKWNQWSARLKGQFDSAGRVVGAYEDGISQITAFKFFLGGSTSFSGFSPIMVNTGEFLRTEIFSQKNNVVYYTKDTTSATVRGSRRGGVIYCRIEQNNYSVEYPLCSSPSPIIALEHVWAFGGRYYIIALTTTGYITFVSSPYPIIANEEASAAFSIQSVLYSLVVEEVIMDTEEAAASFGIQSVAYMSVVYRFDAPTEEAKSEFSITQVLYEEMVEVEEMDVEETSAEFSVPYVAYIYDPPTPPPAPVVVETTIAESVQSTISATGLTYA